MKHRFKICIDILMYILFVYLMSYRPGMGLLNHGLGGCLLFLLFIIHHIVNRQWYHTIKKGRYSFYKGFMLFIDILLLLLMIMMMISSILLSKEVFVFSPFMTANYARTLHVFSTSWGFVVMLIHMGLHTSRLFYKIQRKVKNSSFEYSYYFCFILVMMIGVICFIDNGLWKYMFLMTDEHTYYHSLMIYFQYIMITILFCQVTHLCLFVQRQFKKLKQ